MADHTHICCIRRLISGRFLRKSLRKPSWIALGSSCRQANTTSNNRQRLLNARNTTPFERSCLTQAGISDMLSQASTRVSTVYDYRTNVALYPKWQAFLKEQQPDTIIFWGQDDIFFTREGGEAYLRFSQRRRCTGLTLAT
jgi:hypothetical protein